MLRLATCTVFLIASVWSSEVRADDTLRPDALITARPGEGANGLERFAVANPDAPQAERALARAIAIRMRFGQTHAVRRGMAIHQKLFGANELRAGEVGVMWAAYETRLPNQPAPIRRRVDARLSSLTKHSSPVVRWPALALSARRLAARGMAVESLAAYREIADAFLDLKALNAHLETLGGGRSQERERRVRCTDAAGEALFRLAEAKRRSLPREMPVPRADDNVARFVHEQVTPWVDEVITQSEEVIAGYDELKRLRIYAHDWQARGRASQFLAATHVRTVLHGAPYPREWDRDGMVRNTSPPILWSERRAAYVRHLGALHRRPEKRAKQLALRCMRTAATWQILLAETRACEAWLSTNFPAEFSLMDELRPRVGQRSSTTRAAPIDG